MRYYVNAIALSCLKKFYTVSEETTMNEIVIGYDLTDNSIEFTGWKIPAELTEAQLRQLFEDVIQNRSEV